MRLFFDPDLASSYRDISLRLERAAAGSAALSTMAADVSERYARALTCGRAEHERAWHDFIAALSAFVRLATPSRDVQRLATIVDENRDLVA